MDKSLAQEVLNSSHTILYHGTIKLIPADASKLAVAFIFFKSDIVNGVANGISLTDISILMDACELWIHHFYSNYRTTDTIVGRDTVSPPDTWKKAIDEQYMKVRDLINELLPNCRDRNLALSRLTDAWIICRDYDRFDLHRFCD
jgi:hypothetical protein